MFTNLSVLLENIEINMLVVMFFIVIDKEINKIKYHFLKLTHWFWNLTFKTKKSNKHLKYFVAFVFWFFGLFLMFYLKNISKRLSNVFNRLLDKNLRSKKIFVFYSLIKYNFIKVKYFFATTLWMLVKSNKYNFFI